MHLAEELYQYMKEEFKNDHCILIKKFTHCTVLLYFDKQNTDKDVIQLAEHRDMLYNKLGLISPKQNSQCAYTPTCVLTIGDNRIIRMSLFASGSKRVLQLDPFVLNHGSLFVSHSADEVPIFRAHYSDFCKEPSFIKHGNIKGFKRGMLSVALSFRAVDKVDMMNEFGISQQAVPDEQTVQMLNDYLVGPEKTRIELQLRKLLKGISERYNLR